MNNKTDEIEAKEEKERKAQVGGVNIPSSPLPPGSTSTNNPLWRGAAFRWESFDLRGAGSSPRYESSSREEGGGGKSLPATENGSISTIRYFLSLVGARNIRKLANKKYPSDLLPSSTHLEGYPVRGSRERHTRLAFSPKRKLVIDTATRSKKRERGWGGKVSTCIPFRCWVVGIDKNIFCQGGPSDVKQPSARIVCHYCRYLDLEGCGGEKFGEKREGRGFDTVRNRWIVISRTVS